MATPKTAYFNHTPHVSITPKIARSLYESEGGYLAAIHYENTPITADPDECDKEGKEKTGRNLQKLIDYLEDGAIIGVRYTKHPKLRGGIVVGSVPPRSMESHYEYGIHIIGCQGGKIVGSIRVDPYTTENAVLDQVTESLKRVFEAAIAEKQDEDIQILQAIKLPAETSRWIWYRDFPTFATLRHQGTTNGWNKARAQLLAAYHGVEDLRNVPRYLDDPTAHELVELLSFGQLESLCSEYLRRHGGYENYFHEYPVGGSLTAADIIARDGFDGPRVIAQVTFDPPTQTKVEALAGYATRDEVGDRDVDLWFFGREADEATSEIPLDNEIKFRSIRGVYDEMGASDILQSLMRVPAESTGPDL